MRSKLYNRMMTLLSKIDTLQRGDNGTLPNLENIKQEIVQWINEQKFNTKKN